MQLFNKLLGEILRIRGLYHEILHRIIDKRFHNVKKCYIYGVYDILTKTDVGMNIFLD